MDAFEKLNGYIKLPTADKRKISFKRKYNVVLTIERQEYLFYKYFKNLDRNPNTFTINVLPQDYMDIEVLLRCYWMIWFEKSGFELTLFSKHPEVFRIKMDVNPQNHWFTYETIPINTMMYLGDNNYGVVNRLKGIPLKKHPNKHVIDTVEASTQINYEYIEAIH